MSFTVKARRRPLLLETLEDRTLPSVTPNVIDLAGLQVEEGSDRLEMPEPTEANRAKAAATARRIAEGDGVKFIDATGLDAIKVRATSENVYLLDVRTRDEYIAGHVPGFRHAPGGQTVQASDSYVGVPMRNAAGKVLGHIAVLHTERLEPTLP